MPTAWRQGDLVAPQDAVALGLVLPDEEATHRFIVASHSCDIACVETLEPDVELLRATVVPEHAANLRNGHSSRTLHLRADDSETFEWLELTIRSREFVSKAALFSKEPWLAKAVAKEGRAILRRWLAQRYARSAFPNAFNNWLDACKVARPLEKFGKKSSEFLRAVYFDLDDDSERDDPSAPYELGVHLVYATEDASFAQAAEKAAVELEKLFTESCLKAGRWHWIELLYCEAVADTAFSLLAADTFRKWKFDHRSVDGEPSSETE